VALMKKEKVIASGEPKIEKQKLSLINLKHKFLLHHTA